MYHFDDFADKDKDLEIISLKKDPKHGRDASYFGQFFFADVELRTCPQNSTFKNQDTFFLGRLLATNNALAIYRCKKWFNPHHNHN